MSNWNKNLGISKSDWENLTPATQELLWNRSKKEEAKDKAKANKRIKAMGNRRGGRSQEEGQEVGKKYTVTSKVTTQKHSPVIEFFKHLTKHNPKK